MGLEIPTWKELSRDEQIPIFDLPIDQSYIVVGGPGTGKTIMALYRAAKWKAANAEAGCNIKFLIFNRPLRKYLTAALEHMEISEANAQTWHSWFYKYYSSRFFGRVPQVSDYHPDWDQIMPKFDTLAYEQVFDHLILDEAQDFPPELLEILHKLSKNVTILGDPQQRLNGAPSTTANFTYAFPEAARRVYYLTRNFRNTIEISQVSHLFYTGDKCDIPAQPRRSGEKPRVRKFYSFDDVVDFIATHAENNPTYNIGVLLPLKEAGEKHKQDTQLINSYYKGLRDLTDVKVQKYVSKSDEKNFDFETSGIKIMSYSTAKGLEFDTVFLPEINHEFFGEESTLKSNHIYVASSRAKSNLFFLYTEDNDDSFVLRRLKNNDSFLEWG